MARHDGFAADAGCVRIVDATSKQAYYLTVDVHEDKDDLEQSSFDLKVTDGRRAWKLDGVDPAFRTRLSAAALVPHESALICKDCLAPMPACALSRVYAAGGDADPGLVCACATRSAGWSRCQPVHLPRWPSRWSRGEAAGANSETSTL